MSAEMTRADPSDPAADAREDYYAEARSWGIERERDLLRSRRVAWIVAAIATGVAVLLALALIALAPIKTVVPYTVLVDRTTGFVQVLEGTQPQTVKPQTAMTHSMLAQYVVARESFEIDTLAQQYKKVALWSAEAARRDYLALMPASNPMSPLNAYPRSAIVTTRIESVTPTGLDTAQVRFTTERRDSAQGAVTRGWYAAQIRYRFSGEPMALEDRLANPLGFQVIEYRRDQEAAPQETAAPAPAAAAPPAAAVPVAPRPPGAM
jgi:type IV secretion system protein VirB8